MCILIALLFIALFIYFVNQRVDTLSLVESFGGTSGTILTLNVKKLLINHLWVINLLFFPLNAQAKNDLIYAVGMGVGYSGFGVKIGSPIKNNDQLTFSFGVSGYAWSSDNSSNLLLATGLEYIVTPFNSYKKHAVGAGISFEKEFRFNKNKETYEKEQFYSFGYLTYKYFFNGLNNEGFSLGLSYKLYADEYYSYPLDFSFGYQF